MPDTRKGSKQLDILMPDNDQLRAIIREEFEKIRKDFQSELIDSIKDAVTSEFTKLNEKICEQQKRIECLEKALLHCEYSRLLDKRRENACNLILSGLPESEEENDADTEGKTTDILQRINVDAASRIVSAVRIGRKNDHRPRKIKIVTKSLQDRNSFLRNSRLLLNANAGAGGPNLYLDTDRPLLDRKEAARLRAKAKKLRSECPGKVIKIFKDKLLVDGSVVDIEQPLRHITFSSD